MFQTFFQKITAIVYQNKFASIRVFKIVSITFLALGLFLLKIHYNFNDGIVYGNPIFALISIMSFAISFFSIGGAMIYSLTDGKLSFQEFVQYILYPKQKITIKYVKDNFDMLYKVFEKNNDIEVFRTFYNSLEKNNLSEKDYEALYKVMNSSNFSFNIEENHHSQSEQSFEKMVTLSKNKANQKTSDVKFFDNE